MFARIRAHLDAFHVIGACLTVFLFHVSAIAGNVSGRVVDPNGSDILDAAIKLECREFTVTAVTNVQGRFAISMPFASANCDIEVRREGFEVYRKTLVNASGRPLEIRLEVARRTDAITVTAPSTGLSPQLDRTVVFSDEELKKISNNVEDWIRYAKLMAGVGGGGEAVYVDGLPSSGLPPPNMIAWIIVIPDFSAEYADGDFTHIDIITKSPDRHVHLSFGGNSLGAGGRNVLGASSTPFSALGNFLLTGPIPRMPMAFAFSGNDSSNSNPVAIQAVTPSGIPASPPVVAAVSHTFQLSTNLFYYGKEQRQVHFSYDEARFAGANVGVGGLNLLETGASLTSSRQEMRATIDKGWQDLIYRGGVLLAKSSTSSNANSAAAGLTVLGNFVGGGSPMTQSTSRNTVWTLKNVLQTTSPRNSWIFGATFSGAVISRLDVPNINGMYTFPTLPAYFNAATGEATGTWNVVRGNGDLHLSRINGAVFVQHDFIRRQSVILSGGLREDFQNGVGELFSPRASLALLRRGFVIRTGAGVFVREIPDNVFIKAIQGDGSHLEQYFFTPTSLSGAAQLEPSKAPLILTQLSPTLALPRENLAKASVERQTGKIVPAVEYTWAQDRHLLGAVRLPGGQNWLDLVQSNRVAERHRVRTQLAGNWNGQRLMLWYEWTHSFDNTDGPFSFPANQANAGQEWARSAGVAPQSAGAAGYFKLPSSVFLSLTETWKESAPYNITTGLDPAGDGLYNDRGGRPRNSGNGPDFRSLSAYFNRRIVLSELGFSRLGDINVGFQADNLLGNRNYISIGSISGSATFGQPLAAMPGRSLRVSLSFN